MHQHSNGHTSRPLKPHLIARLEDLPPQPPVASHRIKALLSRALIQPESMAPDEIREMAAAVVFHLLSEKAKEGK